MSNLSDAALDYAAGGILVFPCKPRGKEPLTAHGLKDATKDADTIRKWWSAEQGANIGAPCGLNHWTVIDIDTDSPQGAFEIANELGLTDRQYPLSRTGKGRHVFCRTAEGVGPSTRVGGLTVDIRSGESYVILPPSVHPNGRTYRWNVPLSRDLPPVPARTLEILRSRSTKQLTLSADPKAPAIPSGRRNAELARMAGALRRYECDKDTIVSHLLKVNAARCKPPLSEREVHAIARSVSRYEPASYSSPNATGGPQGASKRKTLSRSVRMAERADRGENERDRIFGRFWKECAEVIDAAGAKDDPLRLYPLLESYVRKAVIESMPELNPEERDENGYRFSGRDSRLNSMVHRPMPGWNQFVECWDRWKNGGAP